MEKQQEEKKPECDDPPVDEDYGTDSVKNDIAMELQSDIQEDDASVPRANPQTDNLKIEQAFLQASEPPHPDESLPGFLMEVPDKSAKKYIFRSKSKTSETDYDMLTVIVPERMQASYGLYVWPASPILAWYLFEHRQHIVDKRILELGAGTALPGVTASMCGAHVILSDAQKLTHCLEQCHLTAEMNGVRDKVEILGLTWGLFLNNTTKLRNIDLIIGSDCFYDPTVFEDLIATVAYILENNPSAKFLCTYQERSSDWSIQHLLTKWDLKCKHIPLKELANDCQVDLMGMMQNHTIHLLEITLKVS